MALNNLPFYMVDANDQKTPETGLSGISCEISQDGGAFASMTNSPTEISDGVYRINATQAEMNADFIILKFSHANAATRLVALTTQEV